MKNTNGNPYFMELRASSMGKMDLTFRCWQFLKAAYIVIYSLNWNSGIQGMHGQEIKFCNLFSLGEFNDFIMQTIWRLLDGQCSDHSIHIQMILIFGKIVRGLCPCKKKLLIWNKKEMKRKNLTMINNSLQDSTITPKIS